MPRHILVIYGTTRGQTAKIARRIADVLAESGDVVAMRRADDHPERLPLTGFDGIVVGASVIAGGHHRAGRRFARRSRTLLERVPSAFFSVRAPAASRDERGRANARRCVDEFIRETGWTPRLTETIAGRIAYTR